MFDFKTGTHYKKRRMMMKTGFILSMFFLAAAIQLLTWSSAQCQQNANIGKSKIALIVAKPADDGPAKNGPDKSVPAEIEGAEIPVQDTAPNDDLTKDKMNKGAEAEVEEVDIPVQENASDHFNRGKAHDNAGMYREAIESYKNAIMIKPDYQEAYYNIAFSYLMLNDAKSAHEEYLLLKEINPQQADDFYNKALLMVRSNPENKYVIQAGAFRNIQNADAMLDKLKANYLHAQIEAEDGYSKVRVFGMKNKEEADLMMKDIRDKLKIDPFIFIVPAR
jgi:tetratricopeptide (TPR) repeat protein